MGIPPARECLNSRQLCLKFQQIMVEFPTCDSRLSGADNRNACTGLQRLFGRAARIGIDVASNSYQDVLTDLPKFN